MPKIIRKFKATIPYEISIENYGYRYIDIKAALGQGKT